MDDSIFKVVGELALDSHMRRSPDLTFNLPENFSQLVKEETTDYLVDGKTVRFSSIEARNRCVAAYVFEKNRMAFANDAQQWLTTGNELWRQEIGDSDSACGRLLAFVDGINDLFSTAAIAIEDKKIQLFEILRVVESAVPYLKRISVDGLIKLCTAHFERSKNHVAIGTIFNSVEKILTNRPDVCREIHARIKFDTTEVTSPLHLVSLLPLAQSDPAAVVQLSLEDAESSNDNLKSAALWTLGRLITAQVIPAEASAKTSRTVVLNMSATNERVRQTAITVAAHALPVSDDFLDPLVLLAKSDDQYALVAIANTLMMNLKELKNRKHFNEWIRLLCKLTPESKGGIDNFDSVLYRLIQDESKQQLVLSCLTDWVDAHADELQKDSLVGELFNSTASELANRPELFSEIITVWLLADSRRQASAAAGLLSYMWVHGFKKVEFSSKHLDGLEQRDLLFLARRMLGYVSSEDHLISLIMSLLKIDDPQHRTFGLVHSLFVQELGQDYPETALEALEAAKSSATEAEWITYYTTIIDEIRSWINTLKSLPKLTEISPSPALQRQFAKARAKQMNAISEEAEQKSIWSMIATKIPIKAGLGSFSFRNGRYTEPSYMQPYSTEIALPRRHAIDTVGYELSRFLFRLAKRDEE